MSGGRQRPTWGKFKLQVQTTVDGYMAGPSGEMDWTTSPWTDDIVAYVYALTETIDCIVLGRKLAEGFVQGRAAGTRWPGPGVLRLDELHA
jgi:hypothetical protein